MLGPLKRLRVLVVGGDKGSIRSRTCCGEEKLAPAKALLARIENQTSIWLSHDAWVGMK